MRIAERKMNIVLYQPQIPPNTGNIARLCVGTKSHLHLIHPLGFEITDASVKRAGLDYWKYLTLTHHQDWESFLEFISHKKPQARFHLYSKKVTRPYTQAEYQADDFLIFGSETKGLPENILEKYSENAYTIPMWGETRSLNLATSVGIVVYEALRQVTGNFQNI